MVRITRVYTRTGDNGETALVGGKRLPKDSPRIEAYGTIDELNSIVGLARVFNEERLRKGKAHRVLDGILRRIQDELFDLGSELATPPDFSYEGRYRVGEGEVKRLEGIIDEGQKELGPLHSFVLPRGGEGRRVPAPVPHRLPQGGAGDPTPLPGGRDRRVASQVCQPLERSLLRAGALCRKARGRERVPVAEGTTTKTKTKIILDFGLPILD